MTDDRRLRAAIGSSCLYYVDMLYHSGKLKVFLQPRPLFNVLLQHDLKVLLQPY